MAIFVEVVPCPVSDGVLFYQGYMEVYISFLKIV
jgi:hypothetical protein